MLEEIDSVRWRAATVQKLRLDERLQPLLNPMLGKPISNRAYRLMRKLSAERRTDLRYLFGRAQTIEAGDQQALQSARNRQRRNPTVQPIFVVDLARQSFAGDVFRYGGHLTIAQPVQHYRGGVRVAGPRWHELRPVGDQQQHWQVSGSIGDCVKQLA